jgi:DNA-binding NarL/FixJ family response regulator
LLIIRLLIKITREYNYTDLLQKWWVWRLGWRTSAPDVIITNVQNHNGVDAVEITRLVKLTNPEVPVIVLTEDERDPFAINAVQASISAYILRKTVSTKILESVIRTVIKTGSAVLSAPLMKTVVRWRG